MDYEVRSRAYLCRVIARDAGFDSIGVVCEQLQGSVVLCGRRGRASPGGGEARRGPGPGRAVPAPAPGPVPSGRVGAVIRCDAHGNAMRSGRDAVL